MALPVRRIAQSGWRAFSSTVGSARAMGSMRLDGFEHFSSGLPSVAQQPDSNSNSRKEAQQRQSMSVKALFTVQYGGKPYQVVTSYNPGKSVAGVKELIVAKLKSNYDGFDWIKAGYLTLKTVDGDAIMEDEMPDGKKFLAEMLVPSDHLLAPFDADALVPPLDVSAFPIGQEEPPFCAEDGWLDACFSDLQAGLHSEETIFSRVRPMSFVRCSCGGKTRVLLEMNKLLRERLPDVSVVYVSFNNFSPLEEWELRDPVAALCRRIAFSAFRGRVETHKVFEAFNRSLVRENDIIQWLGDTPCLLLIDDLHMLELDKKRASRIATFLKENFLFQRGRYFAFSSHMVPSGRRLAEYMDSIGERGIVIHQLPLISSMSEARNKLRWPDLTVGQALYRGFVPALISYTRGLLPPPFDKRKAAVAELEHHWNDEKVKNLLSSFLSGSSFHVPSVLLQLMNVYSIQGEGKITWIPYHMVYVLESICESTAVSSSLRNIVSAVMELLRGLEMANTNGGSAWKSLFAIALIIRLVTGNCFYLLPIYNFFPSSSVYDVSYNALWEPKAGCVSFPQLTTMEQLVEGLTAPSSYPHIAVFNPPHSCFEAFDVVVVAYLQANVRQIYGYQLKEGRVIPKTDASNLCEYSYVISGFASEQETRLRGWKMASSDDIDRFLGVTGSCLAPKQWRTLEDP